MNADKLRNLFITAMQRGEGWAVQKWGDIPEPYLSKANAIIEAGVLNGDERAFEDNFLGSFLWLVHAVRSHWLSRDLRDYLNPVNMGCE